MSESNRARPRDDGLYAYRHRIARFGERLAARFLVDRGAHILGRNVRVGRGEIDLHASVAGTLVAVEVKTLVAGPAQRDALAQLSVAKGRRVRRYAGLLSPPAYRVDLVAVTLRRDSVDLRWVPFAA